MEILIRSSKRVNKITRLLASIWLTTDRVFEQFSLMVLVLPALIWGQSSVRFFASVLRSIICFQIDGGWKLDLST